MNKRERQMIQRSVAIPEDIDGMALAIMDEEPELSYSAALRRILRAGIRQVESERNVSPAVQRMNESLERFSTERK